MRWYNNGTYGWIYTRTLYAGKRWDEDLWIVFDYLDTDVDRNVNLRVGLTASWTETIDRVLFSTLVDHKGTAIYTEPPRTLWNHKEIKY